MGLLKTIDSKIYGDAVCHVNSGHMVISIRNTVSVVLITN